MISYIVERCVPNNRKDDSNEKEDKSCYQNTSVIMLFGFLDLAGPIIGIAFLPGSAHGDEGKDRISQNKSETNKSTLAADIHHAGEKCHHDAGDEESVRQDLNIDRCTLAEETLGPDHQKGDQHLNANTNTVIS